MLGDEKMDRVIIKKVQLGRLFKKCNCQIASDV